MWWTMALGWVGCARTEREREEPTDGLPTGTVTPTPSTPTEETPTETGSTGLPTEPAYDCSVLPPIPVTFTWMPEFDTSEDFDFDADGFLCTNHHENLACRDLAGNTKVHSPLEGFTAGIRSLPGGDWLVNVVWEGSLVRVDGQTGGKTVVLAGLGYPNGLEIGHDGYAYVGETSAGSVRQVQVDTGAQHVVATGLVAPNGVILSPDEQTLYVASFGGGVVYAVDRLGPTSWDTPRILWTATGPDGGFDGINVDLCGTVYVTEFTVGRVHRITEDGLGNGILVDVEEGWIPNMRWGHDLGGWDSNILYLSALTGLYALDMGVPGKKHVLAP